jgi:hypothetical protein
MLVPITIVAITNIKTEALEILQIVPIYTKFLIADLVMYLIRILCVYGQLKTSNSSFDGVLEYFRLQ